MKPIIYETWVESESGWGIRPDGYSLHLNEKDCEEYIKDYWDREKKRNTSGQTPHEYSRPDDNKTIAFVNNKLHKKISETKNGLRLWESEFNKLIENKEIVFKLEDIK